MLKGSVAAKRIYSRQVNNIKSVSLRLIKQRKRNVYTNYHQHSKLHTAVV